MKNKLLIAGITLLALTSLVYAQTSRVAKPTITAEYEEEVRIDAAEIRGEGNSYRVIQDPTTDWNTTYTFTSEQLLTNGNYTLWVTASDRVENTANSNFSFIVDVPFRIILQQPEFGVTDQTTYDTIIETTEPAHCGWSQSQYTETFSELLQTQWADGEDTDTYQRQHTFSDVSWNDQRIWFICRNEAGNNTKQDYTFRIDQTQPTVQVNATTNPIVDPAEQETTLTISTDEPTVCWRDGNTIGDVDPSTESDYDTTHQETLTYEIYDTDTHNFNYNITCQNKAGLTGQNTYTVTVDLTHAFTIEMISPEEYTSSTNIDFTVETQISTACEYRPSGNGTYQSMTSTDGLTHTTNLQGLNEGMHEYDVRCRGQRETEETTHSFTVDTTPPRNVSINAQNAQCGPESLTASFSANDEGGIKHYNYTLTRGTNTIVNWTTTSGNQVGHGNFDIQTGTYTWEMRAVDGADNTQPANPVDVNVYNSSDDRCDTTEPVVILNDSEDPTRNANDVVVNCQDGNSGCSEYYNYTIVQPRDRCLQNSTRTQNMDSRLTVPCGQKACMWIPDNQGNWAYREYLSQCEETDDNETDNNQTDDDQDDNQTDGPDIPPDGPDGGEPECGNGVVEQGEECDGNDLDGKTWCDQLEGQTGGRLGCTANCQYDLTRCESEQTTTEEPRDTGPSLLAVIMLILGILMMLGGGGYLGYKQYYGPGIGKTTSHAKNRPQKPESMKKGQQSSKKKQTTKRKPRRKQRQKPTADQIRKRKKRKLREKARKAKKKKEREKLFDEFEEKEEKGDTDVSKHADEAFGEDEESSN